MNNVPERAVIAHLIRRNNALADAARNVLTYLAQSDWIYLDEAGEVLMSRMRAALAPTEPM